MVHWVYQANLGRNVQLAAYWLLEICERESLKGHPVQEFMHVLGISPGNREADLVR